MMLTGHNKLAGHSINYRVTTVQYQNT